MNQPSMRFDTWFAWSILVSVVFALVAPTPATATDTVVAHLREPSSIRTYAGIQVFSAFEAGAYHLAVLRGGNIERLPVPPSPAPFAADIGPDRNGGSKLIYTRCKTDRSGCDLFVFSLASGGTESPVRSANTSANEVTPTLWKGRIAFARQSNGRSRAVVYTRKLTAPRSRRSERLPSIPPPAKTGSVAELELRGDRLAEIVNYASHTELRLVNIANRSTRRLVRAGVGEAGQHLTGVGFAGGYLAWAFGGAIGEDAGIYRYRLATGERSWARFPRVVDYDVAGLALFAASSAYIIDAQPDVGGCGGDEGAAPPVVRLCQVIRSQPLRFRRVRG